MEDQKITYIKEETQVSKKTNKPYQRLSLKTDRWGERFMSGFGSQETKGWKVGDTVKLKVEEVAGIDGRKFLNFDYERAPALVERIKALEITVEQLKESFKPIFLEYQKSLSTAQRGYEYPEGRGEPNFEENLDKIRHEDVPF